MTYREVAEAVSCSPMAVRGALTNLNLYPGMDAIIPCCKVTRISPHSGALFPISDRHASRPNC